MNTDDNERYLAQLAMQGVPLITPRRMLKFQGSSYGSIAAPTVKPVKGFDASAQKAERAKAKRARKLAKSLQTVKG